MCFFFHFILIILISYLKCSDTYSIEFSYYLPLPYISLNFSLFNKSIFMPLATIDKYTFINPEMGFLRKCTKEKPEKNITLTHEEILVQPCESRLFLENQKILTKFNFYVFTKYPTSFFKKYGYSLSFNIPDGKYSFMNQIMNEYKLKKKIFSFQQKNDKRYTHFGELPKYELDQYKYKTKCKVKTNDWSCFIKRIKFDNNILNVNKYAIFDSTVEGFIDSKDFLFFMISNLLSKNNSNYCSTNIDELTYKENIICRDEVLQINHKLIIEFDEGKYIEFKVQDLFSNFGLNGYSKFEYDFLYGETNHFVFGFSFLKEMNLSIFDYEDKAIYLYSDTFIMNTFSIMLKSLFIIVAFFLVMASIFLFCIHFFQNNKKHYFCVIKYEVD